LKVVVDHVALHARRIGKLHEGLPLFGSGRGVDHRLGRAVVIVDLDQITGAHLEFGHVLGIDLYERIGPAIHHKLVVLVQIGVLPEGVGAPVVDEVLELGLLLLLAWRLQAATSLPMKVA
jgi:hypothetical protein